MTQGILLAFTNIAFAVFVNAISFSPLYAQNTKDSLFYAQILETAEALATEKQYKRSNKKTLQATKGFEQLQDWDNYLKGYYRIFLNAYFSKDYATGITHLNKGLQNLPTDQSEILARMNTFLGFAYDEVGDVPASLAAYEASVPPLKIADDSLRLAKVYGNIGVAHIQLGDYSKAADYLQTACALGRKLSDPGTLWNNLINLGDVYFYQGDWKNAQVFYQQARMLNDPEDGILDFYDAKVLLQSGRHQKALKATRRAIKQTRATYGNEEEYTASLKKLEGEIYLDGRQPNKALSVFKKLLPYYRKAPNKRELGKLYMLIAKAQQTIEKYDGALKTYQTALRTFLPVFKKKAVSSNPPKSLWSREVWLMEIFSGKGKCFFEKYQKTKKEKWLYLAEENYELAIQFIEGIKLGYNEIESKLILGDYTHPFYEDVIKTKLVLYGITQKQSYQEAAFQTAQKANAFVLRELLNEQQALEIVGVSEDTIKQMEMYQQEISKLYRQLERGKGAEGIVLQQEIFDLKQKQAALKKAIVIDHPRFAQLRNDLEVTTSSQLQEEMEASSVLIKYFIGKEKLYQFSISAQAFHIDTLNLPENFDRLINQYRRAISNLDFINDSMEIAEQQYLHSAHQLYLLLLEKPLSHFRQEAGIQSLRIIGDGILNTIPFSALLTQASSSWTNSEHLVVSQYAVSYAYFCKMLLSENSIDQSGEFMSFGLEFDDYTLQHLQKLSKDSIKNKALLNNIRSGSLSNLPFSDDEARELADLMGGTSWTNEQATKSNFLKNIPTASIIHTATHSILNQDNPGQSSLIFTKTKDSLDNLLRLQEIYNLQLDAEMIVLSACNTGFGRSERGEGLNSLARAFNFSGIPSVIATHWNISDEASKKMMELYYGFLQQGEAKDIALRHAQLEYLRNDKISSPVFRLPVYWAAWMSVGDNRPLNERTSNSFPFIWILLGIVLLVVIGARRQQRKGD